MFDRTRTSFKSLQNLRFFLKAKIAQHWTPVVTAPTMGVCSHKLNNLKENPREQPKVTTSL